MARAGFRARWFRADGGTGLALQLGHRVSEDFDFFSSSGFDPDQLKSALPFFKDLDPANADIWVQRKRYNLEAYVNRGGLVKVAFFGGGRHSSTDRGSTQGSGIAGAGASLADLPA